MPEIEYTRSGEIAIAYQAFGQGRARGGLVRCNVGDLVSRRGERRLARDLEDFASFSRLLHVTSTGPGLSDRPRDLGSLETRMDDIRAVLDITRREPATW